MSTHPSDSPATPLTSPEVELHESRGRLTFAQFSNVFIPFTLLLCAAMLRPELRPKMVYWRAVYSIWVTILFMTPALFLFFWPGSSDRKNNYWLLFWTGGFLAYLVHFYFTVGVIFHGSLAEVYAKQGPLIATSNLLDTAWWAFDLVLAWFVRSEAKWIKLQRIAAHVYIPVTFFVSAVIIKHGVVRGLGIAMTVAMLTSVGVRFVRRRQAAATNTGRLAPSP